MSTCYQGEDPFDNERGRMAIWAWAKKHGGIDEGKSFDDVHDAINQHFYNGFAPPEWITDKLAGRKTPLKPFAMAAKIAEINRRNVTAQAKRLTEEITRQQKQGAPERLLRNVFDFPRRVAVGKHSLALAQTHPGDLVFQPRNMGVYWQNVFRTWDKAFPFVSAKRSAEHEVAVNDFYNNEVKRSANHDMAVASGLDIGEKAHGGNLVPGTLAPGTEAKKLGTPTDRAWKLIQIARYKMFDSEYNLALKRNPTLDSRRISWSWGNCWLRWPTTPPGQAAG